MSMLVFIVILGILIVVHEWGHFIAAKVCGIGVEVFSIGFGPKLFARKVGGTQFTLSAIPLGGYVKLAGDERAGCKGEPNEFFSHPIRHRAAVVMAGPVVNFIFAYLCFFFLFSVTGYPIMDSQVGDVLSGYPAHAAGIRSGDRIIRIDETPVAKWAELQGIIFTSGGRAMDFTIQRGDQQIVIEHVVPVLEAGDGENLAEGYPVVGLTPRLQKYGIGRSLLRAGEELWSIIAMTAKALYRVITGAEAAANALAGPIRIFDIIRGAMVMGFSHLVFIVGVISASLGFFNLFPIPVLDGGHLVFFALEGIRRKPLSPRVEEWLVRAGFSLLIGLMVFVVYNDLVQMGLIGRLAGLIRSIF